MALNGKFDIVCLAAVKQIFNQLLLAKIAMKTTDRKSRRLLGRLNEPGALDQVASGQTTKR